MGRGPGHPGSGGRRLLVAVLALSAPAPQEAGGSVVVVLRAVSRAPPANLPSPSRDGCPPLARVRNGGREPWPFEVQWVTVPGHQVNGRAGVLLPLTPSPARPRPTAPSRASPCPDSHDTTARRPRRTVSNLNYVPGQVCPMPSPSASAVTAPSTSTPSPTSTSSRISPVTLPHSGVERV